MSSLSQIAVNTVTFLRHPPKLLYIFLPVIFLKFTESVSQAPTIRLLENTTCQQYYQKTTATAQVDELLCKILPIQSKLARIQGGLSFFDTIPGMIPVTTCLVSR